MFEKENISLVVGKLFGISLGDSYTGDSVIPVLPVPHRYSLLLKVLPVEKPSGIPKKMFKQFDKINRRWKYEYSVLLSPPQNVDSI